MRATLHLVSREYEALADDFVTLGMLPGDSEKAAVVPALAGVFAEALRGGVNNLSFGQLSGNLGRTMYQFKFRIPPYYTLLVRSLSVLEVRCRQKKNLGRIWAPLALLLPALPARAVCPAGWMGGGGGGSLAPLTSLL